jgi:cytochrome c oxidase subunit IV
MYRYWVTWAALLGLTLVMLWADNAALSRALFIGVVVSAMVVKAFMIASRFMHLEYEQRALVGTVIVGLFVTALVLFVLIVPDAIRIHGMLARR